MSAEREELQRLHLRVGWWSLLVFLTLGLALEALHGFKLGWRLDVSNQTRPLTWTLAHAHGTLLATVNIAFAWPRPAWPSRDGSWCAARSEGVAEGASDGEIVLRSVGGGRPRVVAVLDVQAQGHVVDDIEADLGTKTR